MSNHFVENVVDFWFRGRPRYTYYFEYKGVVPLYNHYKNGGLCSMLHIDFSSYVICIEL